MQLKVSNTAQQLPHSSLMPCTLWQLCSGPVLVNVAGNKHSLRHQAIGSKPNARSQQRTRAVRALQLPPATCHGAGSQVCCCGCTVVNHASASCGRCPRSMRHSAHTSTAQHSPLQRIQHSWHQQSSKLTTTWTIRVQQSSQPVPPTAAPAPLGPACHQQCMSRCCPSAAWPSSGSPAEHNGHKRL